MAVANTSPSPAGGVIYRFCSLGILFVEQYVAQWGLKKVFCLEIYCLFEIGVSGQYRLSKGVLNNPHCACTRADIQGFLSSPARTGRKVSDPVSRVRIPTDKNTPCNALA